MSFEVESLEPWVSRTLPGGGTRELPLSALRPTDTHVHGELRITVDGARVPRLGYEPRDVCLGPWIRELTVACRSLLAEDGARHVVDEGEQGLPAIRFQRVGDRVEVSVVDSEISDGVGDLEWGTRSCTLAEFEAGVAVFVERVASTLETASRDVGRQWARRFMDSG